ncbi:MAG: hypothetical protein ACR2MB_12730 [Acidimicrobiales bacterium]
MGMAIRSGFTGAVTMPEPQVTALERLSGGSVTSQSKGAELGPPRCDFDTRRWGNEGRGLSHHRRSGMRSFRLGGGTDEGDDFTHIDWSLGADIEQWSPACHRFSDFVVPELLAGSDAVEVSGVTRSRSRRIPGSGGGPVTSTEHLEHAARQPPERVDGD